MKNPGFIITFLLSSIIILACDKTPALTDPSNPSPLWQTRLAEDELTYSIQPIVYNGNVMFSRNLISGKGPLLLFNGETGEKIWEWSDFFQNQTNDFISNNPPYIYENIAVASPNIPVYAINLDNGQTHWKYAPDDINTSGQSGVRGFKNLAFHNEFFGPSLESNRLRVVDIETGQWRTMYEAERLDGYVPQLRLPVGDIDDAGDTLLYFLEGRYKWPDDSRMNLICFNLTKDSICYKKHYENTGATYQTILHNGNIYAAHGFFVSCFDQKTGVKKWSKDLGTSFDGSGPKILNGLLYVNCGDQKLYCMNPQNGNLKWVVPSVGSASSIFEHNGVLYLSHGWLRAFDAKTGASLWNFKSPLHDTNSNATFSAEMVVDTVNGRVFAHDYVNLYCYKTVR